MYTMCQKTCTFLFFKQLCQKLTIIISFGVVNPKKIYNNSLYIWPPHLYTVATLPWEIQKSYFFNSIVHTYFRLFTLSQKKRTAPVVLQLMCLLNVVYCFLLSALPYSVVSFYLFGQSFCLSCSQPTSALFTATNIWNNATLL